MAGGAAWHTCLRRPPKDHSGQEQNLVQIGSVILSKIIAIKKANDGQMTGCPVVAKTHMTLWVKWAIQNTYIKSNNNISEIQIEHDYI